MLFSIIGYRVPEGLSDGTGGIWIMADSIVRAASAADEERLIAALTLAFGSDPATRWSWPEPKVYLDAFPRFARAFGGGAINLGTAHYAEGFSGVALWLPPGEGPDEESLMNVIEETIPDARRPQVYSVIEQMGNFHPHEPHWYLPLIGVEPAAQGRGVGSILMKHALDICDRDGVPAYLESSNPRNVPFYQRNGFDALGRIQSGDSPVIVPMLRKPR